MERHTKQSMDIPKWSALLVEAVKKPGLIMKAYSNFHSYSIGNQLLALVQCYMRGLQPGPINTFPKWQALGRYVKRGEKALSLCMPITCKRRGEESDDDEPNCAGTFTSFVYKARWFVLKQTEGENLEPQVTPEWDAKRALAALDIDLIPFDSTDGNCQGFARKRQIAINPVAQLPHKTMFHELAHVVIGHTSEADFADAERLRGISAKWKPKQSHCFAVKRCSWKAQITVAATCRTGYAKASAWMRTRFLRRARRKSSARRTRSFEPDD